MFYTKFHLPRPIFYSPSSKCTHIGKRVSVSFPHCIYSNIHHQLCEKPHCHTYCSYNRQLLICIWIFSSPTLVRLSVHTLELSRPADLLFPLRPWWVYLSIQLCGSVGHSIIPLVVLEVVTFDMNPSTHIVMMTVCQVGEDARIRAGTFKVMQDFIKHCNDVIMDMKASQITSLTIVYSTVYSRGDQRKHQSSVSLWPVNSPHKWPVMRKMFPYDDVIMISKHYMWCQISWNLESFGWMLSGWQR